jgi:hypothetical protein
LEKYFHLGWGPDWVVEFEKEEMPQ